MTEYPQCVRLNEVRDRSIAIQDFISFLEVKEIHLAKWHKNGEYLMPAQISLQDLLYEYFGIDSKALEVERRKILDNLRNGTNG